MSPRNRSDQALPRHGWLRALATALTGLVAMVITAALGLWAAGAAGLPDGALAPVIAAIVVMAVGGTVALSANAGDLAGTQAVLTVIPLSVTLVGALVVAAGFLRPLRHRAVAGTGELAGWAGRIALVWLLGLIGLASAARHTFTLSLGDETVEDLGDLFGASPEAGFRANVPLTAVVGLVWLAGVLVLALVVSRRAPLPGRLLRFQESVRPAAYAMLGLLLAHVAVGVVIALAVAVTRGHPAETLAVVLLGLPNVVWLALTVGLGGTWQGQVRGPFDLPMPQVLDRVLRTPDAGTLSLGTLTGQDGRWWWLAVVDALLLLVAAFVMAARSPAWMRAWRHAVHMAVALALTVLTVCLVGRISAQLGLTLFGIGDLGGSLSGRLFLRPDLWPALGLAVLWGLLAGFAGALLARPVRRRGVTRAI